MSEKKKQVIHVKDLIIKADNVHIEPQHPPRPARPPRPVDPFFGPRRRREEFVEEVEEKVEDSEEFYDHKED